MLQSYHSRNHGRGRGQCKSVVDKVTSSMVKNLLYVANPNLTAFSLMGLFCSRFVYRVCSLM